MNGQTFRRDLLASLVVFLVALPLCMGIAIASGVPPALGLITGIVGGLVVGLMAGSPLQVSGPAAGLTVLVWETVQEFGPGMLGPIVLLAGLMQVAAGGLRLGSWFRAISPAVVHGMLSGIGVLIIASQLHLMMDAKPHGNGIANLLAIPDALSKGIFPMDGSTHHLAAMIGLLTIGSIVLWQRLPQPWQRVPAPLVGVMVATLTAWLGHLPIQYVTVPDNLADVIMWPSWASLGRLGEAGVLLAALTIAVIASAETMLTATAVDTLHQGPRTQYDRELAAQGIGNTLCGLLGALPMTGVIVRSSANIQAGALTRASTVLHGLWILVFVAVFPGVLSHVPVTGLAALLVYTGFKLLNPKTVTQLARFGKSEVAIFGVTVGAIVATNLLEGILIGLGLAVAKLVYSMSQLEIRKAQEGTRSYLYLSGSATFIGLPKLAKALEQVPAGSELHIQLDDLSYIDHASLDLLHQWEKQHQATGGKLVLGWDELHAKYQAKRPSAIKGEREPSLTSS